jgi:hypothetical protein
MRKKKEIGLEEMTLRDFIAIFAMQGFLASADDEINPNQVQGFAMVCYALADAMLEVRNGS